MVRQPDGDGHGAKKVDVDGGIMRIFVALDIDEGIRQRIRRFMEGVREFAPDARWVQPESLHVTLKFIGEKPEAKVAEIKQALANVGGTAFDFTIRGHGFFPTPKSARVFWIGIEAGKELNELAKEVDEATATAAVPREDHAFSPHLTLARGGGRSGAPGWRKGDALNKNFAVLQEKLGALPVPEFGTMTAREFVLFESRLLRGGARYTRIAKFPLRGAANS